MKRSSWILAMFFCACVMSCSNNDDNNPTPSINPDAPTTGTWRVTLFTDSGKDETSDFSGYTFTFDSNGTAVATKSGTSKNGSWSASSSSKKFNLNFGIKSDANKPLGELTDDWEIISLSATEIKLKDDNDDSGEYLTFNQN
ncbi:Lipocalin-like domain-containing protein [Chitinophaga sp. YR627]|uniref:lipocalin family protein n=1 Tax=Chitinophaga sp. YR627 TaxID=1881041 RepID=UPI0008E68052|nr:lipocalin family protein [Chitinophaga sp. YR627]SFO58305.1 Lipocalin-like domain-containing protein [Chitinophaga sp. YR627]